MVDILNSLRNPNLVAGFQRLCGVHPTSDAVAEGGGSPHETANHTCSAAEPYASSHANGVSSARKRHRDAPEAAPPKPTPPENGESNGGGKTGGSREAGRQSPGPDRSSPAAFEIRNRVLFYLFHVGAGLGNEFFYCMFFPYWFWNVDGYVCRRLVLVWCWVMYFGQALKDVIRWPRPPSPPVCRLEERYALEYGMPSTHAMVGLAVPAFVLLLTMNRYEYPVTIGCCVGMVWCVFVCLSRLYLGMHSVADVVVGLLLDAVLLPIIYVLLDVIDEFQLTHPYAPLAMFAITLSATLLYPTLDKWSTARGDTTGCLGVTFGVSVASWLNYRFNLMPHDHELVGEPPYHIKMPDVDWLVEATIRMLIGYSILFLTRAIAKKATYNVACSVFKLDKLNTMSNKQQLIVELPYKYITYTMMAINVVYAAPVIFRSWGIERPTAWTEV